MKFAKHLSIAVATSGFMVLGTAAETLAVTLSFHSQIGEPGFGPGQLFVPQGIGVQDSTGNIFVSNGRGLNPDGSFNPNLGNRVEIFNPQGNYLGSIGTGSQEPGDGFDEPADLKFDPATGELHVGDVFNSEIDVYNPNTGEYIRSYGSFGGPVEGRIFFGPGGMSFDNKGNIYITDFSEDVIKVYDASSGELTRTIGSSGTAPGQFQGPAGITVSPNTGRIYVNDQYNYRVQVLAPDGNFLFAFGERGSEPGQLREGIGIEVDEFENIYVADSQNSRVQAFDRNGNFLTSFGQPADAPPPALGAPPFGDPLDLTPGVFNWTAGLHYDDSKLYVGDFFQGRVQVIEAVPEPNTILGVLLFGVGTRFFRKISQEK
ncbi:NHL repeat containing protein [Gloeothece citriformis PCC 7424]|uniref:NHL repeat containing protein n=1 Tax=Gloeothece citriformis (strain PCC 7424) TaxID=65393 RepID=B7KHK9_GLOC7|nr:scytonemin biosynthesis PEP-CTERM protein ScyF [Gloeothece citriformis]ACK70704.1 NHL repeat containing protein [Gloeothece citriformis PCC 7424]